MRSLVWRMMLGLLLLPTGVVLVGQHAAAQVAAATCQVFPETGKQVCDPFLSYWQAHGGLAQQGLPLTDVFDETNPTNGQVYRTQYFERARFEYHPEVADPRYQVLLGLLGGEQLRAKYPAGRPAVPSTGVNCFAQTGQCVDARFFAYWQQHGGLAQQGLPISAPFDEVNPTDGKTYRTQYFERARFEYHPEVAEPQRQVLLGLLGREQLLARYPGTQPGNAPAPPRTYTNPLRPSSPTGTVTSCPDPTIIRGQDAFWYMYCTTEPLNDADKRAGTEHNLVILRSADLVDWAYLGDVFAATPGWVAPGTPLWAPDIHVFDGRYYLYYAAPYTALPGGGSAIGVATAPSPAGPWVDRGAPVVAPEDAPCCPGARRAAIDPAVVVDDTGQRYLFFGSFFGGIAARPLSADGLHTDAAREVAIAHQDRYEGAFVVRHGGYYYLFVSAGDCCSAGSQTGYSVFVGRSSAVLGPYVDREGVALLDTAVGGTPVLAPNGNRWVGTGHNAAFTDLAGQDWFLYHAVDRTDPYFQGTRDWNRRPVLLDPLDWSDGGWPVVNGGRGASDTPQPAPVALPGGPGRPALPALADVQPGPPIAAATDEFGGPGLGPQWGWVRAPAPGGYSLADGALRLATSHTDLHLYPGGPPTPAPILVEGAPAGDFVVETRLRLDVPPTGEGYNYAQAGLVLYGDDENYLKLATVAIWGTRQVEFAKQVTTPPGYPNYGSAFAGPPGAAGAWTWLRLVAQRETGAAEGRYTAYTSRDGVHWSRGATWTHTLGPGARIGLVAMGQAGFTATVDYVRVATLRTP
jgi:arabinan endo-1,5-alpha-L-arabinosidase